MAVMAVTMAVVMGAAIGVAMVGPITRGEDDAVITKGDKKTKRSLNYLSTYMA